MPNGGRQDLIRATWISALGEDAGLNLPASRELHRVAAGDTVGGMLQGRGADVDLSSRGAGSKRTS